MATENTSEKKNPTGIPSVSPTGASAPAPTVPAEAPVPTDSAVTLNPQEAPKPSAAGDQIVLSAEAFNALMKRLGDLESTQNLVLQVQDKNKIAKIEELRRAGKLVKSVKIRKYAGKYIIGWQTVQDEVYKDEQGRLVEKQTVELWYDDGTKSQMSMRQWASAPEYIPFEVTRESKDADGNLFFICVGPDGKTLELNANFIN